MMNNWWRHVPWQWARKRFYDIRRAFFSKERPSGQYFVVSSKGDDIITDVSIELGGSFSYGPNPASYDKGEDLNISRTTFWPIEEWPPDVRQEMARWTNLDDPYARWRAQWWQIHARGWLNSDGNLEMHAHFEPEERMNNVAHLEAVGFDEEKGMDKLHRDLSQTVLEIENQVHYE